MAVLLNRCNSIEPARRFAVATGAGEELKVVEH